MDLTDLNLIVAVADAESITHGAEKAHLSLPSASARIRDLERTLGNHLFERHRRGVTPTSAGELLVRHARSILRDVERMRFELAEYGNGFQQTIRIAANISATTGLLAPVTTTFLAEHDNVRVDVEQRPGHEIVHAVAERRADLGITSDSIDLGGLEAEVLRSDPLVLLTAADTPFAGRTTVTYSEVVSHPFVGITGKGSFPIDRIPPFRAKLPTVEAVCEAVANGIGHAILPRHAVSPWLTSGRLVAIDLDERWAQRHLVLCFTTADELSAAAKAFRASLTSTAIRP